MDQQWGHALADIRKASEAIEGVPERLRSIEASNSANAKSIDELFKIARRPGSDGRGSAVDDLERKDAEAYCRVRRALTIPKVEGNVALHYEPSGSEIDEAQTARKAMRALWRHGDPSRLEPTEKKSLSSFAFGSNSFILAPQISNTVLSCLVDPTDVTGLVNVVQISGPSIKFFIDNVRMQIASWACEASCFANNPIPDLQEGLGELEIKAESLRYIVCAGQDLLADSSFNLENWIMRKVSDGFRRAISDAIMGGDGVGKPQGILHPNAGIPVCDTSLSTPAGQFSWQDCVMLKFEIPVQWHANGTFLMNQRTFALLLTMSDANGRPLLNMMPQGMAGYQLAGSPIVIVSQFPDVAPGATPIGFGDWRQAYTLVNRQATTITVDPYSLGWCLLFKCESRIGGAVTCGNAARLLRIR